MLHWRLRLTPLCKNPLYKCSRLLIIWKSPCIMKKVCTLLPFVLFVVCYHAEITPPGKMSRQRVHTCSSHAQWGNICKKTTLSLYFSGCYPVIYYIFYCMWLNRGLTRQSPIRVPMSSLLSSKGCRSPVHTRLLTQHGSPCLWSGGIQCWKEEEKWIISNFIPMIIFKKNEEVNHFQV